MKIINAYKEKGYHNIKIRDTSLVSDIDFASNLKLTISEGEKIKIGQVIINGNNEFSEEKIKQILKNNKEQRWYLPWR